MNKGSVEVMCSLPVSGKRGIVLRMSTRRLVGSHTHRCLECECRSNCSSSSSCSDSVSDETDCFITLHQLERTRPRIFAQGWAGLSPVLCCRRRRRPRPSLKSAVRVEATAARPQLLKLPRSRRHHGNPLGPAAVLTELGGGAATEAPASSLYPSTEALHVVRDEAPAAVAVVAAAKRPL